MCVCVCVCVCERERERERVEWLARARWIRAVACLSVAAKLIRARSRVAAVPDPVNDNIAVHQSNGGERVGDGGAGERESERARERERETHTHTHTHTHTQRERERQTER